MARAARKTTAEDLGSWFLSYGINLLAFHRDPMQLPRVMSNTKLALMTPGLSDSQLLSMALEVVHSLIWAYVGFHQIEFLNQIDELLETASKFSTGDLNLSLRLAEHRGLSYFYRGSRSNNMSLVETAIGVYEEGLQIAPDGSFAQSR